MILMAARCASSPNVVFREEWLSEATASQRRDVPYLVSRCRHVGQLTPDPTAPPMWSLPHKFPLSPHTADLTEFFLRITPNYS